MTLDTQDGAPASVGAPVLELTGLTVRFGAVEALSNVTAAFNGRALGLLGPNGAGKTTLLRTLLGFHEATAGSARILGKDIRAQGTAVRESIGYMPESDAYIASLSGVRTVRLMAELSGLSRWDALERAHEALNYVGLGEARYRPVGTYSLGMRQLIKLAQAIVHGPRLLLLDEPTNALDPPARHRMLELIRDIRDSGHVQVVVCSHLLRDVESSCDEVAILKEGKLVARKNLTEWRSAGPSTFELEVAGAQPEVADVLGKAGFAVESGLDGRLTVTVPPGAEVRDIYAAADGRGMHIRRIVPKRDTLEDFFMAAMTVPTTEENDGGL
jgi:ABC-2 type transport system ATP-binding protein